MFLTFSSYNALEYENDENCFRTQMQKLSFFVQKKMVEVERIHIGLVGLYLGIQVNYVHGSSPKNFVSRVASNLNLKNLDIPHLQVKKILKWTSCLLQLFFQIVSLFIYLFTGSR